MDQHSLFPRTAAEQGVLIQRLGGLAGHVMSVRDWQAMLSAARQLLPRSNKQLATPSEVDLWSFSTDPAGKILSATLSSFSSPKTFDNNRRYSIASWIVLARNFYELAPYTVPPQTLGFARDLLASARKGDADSFVLALSVIVRNEPMLVRQVASPADLDRWARSLTGRLEACCRTGETYRDRATSGELDTNDYDDWYGDSEEVLELATEFFRSFAHPLPDDLTALEELREAIDRPAERDDDSEPYDREASGRLEREYWTVERIFEDL